MREMEWSNERNCLTRQENSYKNFRTITILNDEFSPAFSWLINEINLVILSVRTDEAESKKINSPCTLVKQKTSMNILVKLMKFNV